MRSVIEAYSKSAVIAGQGESSACGVMISEGKDEVRVRMTDRSGNRFEYIVDRWD